MNAAQTLDLQRLSQALEKCEIGHTISYHDRTETTMPIAHELARMPTSRSGTIIVAEEQTAGKGRRGRQWAAPYATAVLFSVLLKPPQLSLRPALVPMAVGMGIQKAIAGIEDNIEGNLSTDVQLKWPNDVLLKTSNGWGKVAGILAESSFYGENLSYVVVGIGINVNQTAADLPTVEYPMVQPVSLRTALGHTIDRNEVLIQTCRRLASYLHTRHDEAAILAEWKTHLTTLNKRVDVLVEHNSRQTVTRGVAIDVSIDGDLLVRDDKGMVHSFAAADVSVRESSQ